LKLNINFFLKNKTKKRVNGKAFEEFSLTTKNRKTWSLATLPIDINITYPKKFRPSTQNQPNPIALPMDE